MSACANSGTFAAANSASRTEASRLIERLITPPLVANWGLDENGQVVCLWENRPLRKPFSKRI